MRRKPAFYLRSPATVDDVAGHVARDLHLQYSEAQRNTARRLIREAIAALPAQFPDKNRKAYLEHLLRQIR